MERTSQITVSYLLRDDTGEIPKISLIGKYLRKYGFEIGDRVLVKVSENRIEISKTMVHEDYETQYLNKKGAQL